MGRIRRESSFTTADMKDILGFYVTLYPRFSKDSGVTQAHIEAVLAGTEKPNAALLKAMHLEERSAHDANDASHWN